MTPVRRVLLAAFTLGLAVSISLSEIALAGLAVSLLAGRRDPDRRPLAWPLVAPLAAFAAWTVVSAAASARPLESLAAAKGLLTLGTIYVVLNVLPGRASARRFATALFILVAAVAGLAIVQVVGCPATPPAGGLAARIFRKCARAHGFYSIYMTLAGVLTLVLVSALPGLGRIRASLTWRLGGWLTALVALGLTYVRGAWLGFVAGALGCAFFERRRAWAVLALAAVLLAVVVASPGVVRRARTIGDPRDDSTRDRLIMLDVGLRMARDHPLVGVGVGQVKHLYPVYVAPDALRRHTSHLHNTPLQIMVERGVPGLVAWLAIFGGFFVHAARTLSRIPSAWPEERALVVGCTMAVAAFLVGGLFEYNFGDTEVLLVACSLMALPFVVARDLDTERRSAPR